jgi:Fur family ferric uptake transcriptional regulator
MLRNTRQRDCIRQVFLDIVRPLSPSEIHESACLIHPGIGIATVYRTLKGLVEEGTVVLVEVPGQPPLYEASGKRHHHHFHCRNCGRVFEVEGCPGGIQRLTPAGFHLESHELVLRGLCAECNVT